MTPTDLLISRLETEEPSRELADLVLLECGWRKVRNDDGAYAFDEWTAPTGRHLCDDYDNCEPQRPNPLHDLNAAVAFGRTGNEKHGILLSILRAFESAHTDDITPYIKHGVVFALKARSADHE